VTALLISVVKESDQKLKSYRDLISELQINASDLQEQARTTEGQYDEAIM
jgi:hypothetical protein